MGESKRVRKEEGREEVGKRVRKEKRLGEGKRARKENYEKTWETV